MAAIIELPEGFVLDEPINNNLPDGFILDEPSNSQPISTPKPYKKAQKQEPINYKKDVDTLYDIPQVDMPAKNDGYLTNSDGNKVYTANVGLTQNWDNKGRVYYTDESGERVKFKVNPIQTIGRKFQAATTNLGDYWNRSPIGTKQGNDKAKKILAIEMMTLPGTLSLPGLGVQAGVDTAFSNYLDNGKINPKQIAINTIATLGAGKTLQWAANTPIGKKAINKAGEVAGNVIKTYRGHKLNKSRNISNLSQEEIKVFRNQARDYYNDYIKGTTVNREDIGAINFGNAGIDEQLSKGLHNADVLPELTNQIKKGQYKGTRKDYPREDIKNFHIIENNFKNKNMEYQIAEDGYGNKYYFAKDISNKKELPPLTGTNIQSRTTPNTIIPQLEQNVTPITEIKPSRLTQNAEKSKEVAKYIEEDPPMYEVLHNADLQTNATNEIMSNPEKVRADIISKMTDEEAELTALDFEKSRQLFQSLQEQGRFDEAINLLQGITQKGTKAGQAVQALSMWSKTTPLGAQKYAQMLLDKYNKGVRKELQKHLTKEELQEIGKTFEELHAKRLTERELEVETAKAMKKVYKVVPKTWAQKLDGYRYINMLLSPRSRVKDALLTAKNAGETAIDETIAGGIDKLRSLVTKDKTRYISANPLVGRRAWVEGAKKGFREGVEDVKYGINTSRSGEVGRYGIPNTPTFEGGLLGNAEKLLRYSLNVPDRTFFEARYASSLANQMKARGVTEPTQDMINSAINEAKRAVYQENRPITRATQKIANAVDDATMRAFEQAAGLPQNSLPSASKSLAPFIKTPTNVIAQGAEGLHGGISGFLKLLNAQTPEQIREAELLMGRGARGLGELGLGLGLGKGILDNVKTNIGSKDYYENEITGLKPNSIAIGDKAISLMNMQNNLPLFAGVGLGQNGLSGAYLTIADEIANMPALKALGDLYNLNKEAKYLATSEDKTEELKKLGGNMVRSLGVNYLTSLLPFGGTLGELRNDIDPYARELYTESIPEYIGNRIVNRLPFASKTLPMKYNAIGEPVMVNNIQNPISRALSEAVDFGIRNYTPNETYNELNQFKKDISNSDITGKTLVGVGKAKRKVNINGEQIPLTNKQYSQYQKVYGKLSKNLKGGYYDANANISDEENAKILADIDKSIKEAIAIKELGQAPKKKLKPYTEDILNNWDEYRGTNEYDYLIENIINKGKKYKMMQKIDK